MLCHLATTFALAKFLNGRLEGVLNFPILLNGPAAELEPEGAPMADRSSIGIVGGKNVLSEGGASPHSGQATQTTHCRHLIEQFLQHQ